MWAQSFRVFSNSAIAVNFSSSTCCLNNSKFSSSVRIDFKRPSSFFFSSVNFSKSERRSLSWFWYGDLFYSLWRAIQKSRLVKQSALRHWTCQIASIRMNDTSIIFYNRQFSHFSMRLSLSKWFSWLIAGIPRPVKHLNDSFSLFSVISNAGIRFWNSKRILWEAVYILMKRIHNILERRCTIPDNLSGY